MEKITYYIQKTLKNLKYYIKLKRKMMKIFSKLNQLKESLLLAIIQNKKIVFFILQNNLPKKIKNYKNEDFIQNTKNFKKNKIYLILLK